MNQQTDAMRVAILEDHPIVRETLANTLKMHGVNVVGVVGHPSELHSILHQNESCILILDLVLNSAGGEVNHGQDVLRNVQQFHPNVRVVVLTGDASRAAMASCQAQGAWAYLHKGAANADDLLETLQRVQHGERVFPASALDLDAKPTNSESALLTQLSARERQVLSYLSAGADNLKISCYLGITERTVRAHVCSLYRKLGTENRTQMALLARQLGVEPPAGV